MTSLEKPTDDKESADDDDLSWDGPYDSLLIGADKDHRANEVRIITSRPDTLDIRVRVFPENIRYAVLVEQLDGSESLVEQLREARKKRRGLVNSGKCLLRQILEVPPGGPRPIDRTFDETAIQRMKRALYGLLHLDRIYSWDDLLDYVRKQPEL